MKKLLFTMAVFSMFSYHNIQPNEMPRATNMWEAISMFCLLTIATKLCKDRTPNTLNFLRINNIILTALVFLPPEILQHIQIFGALMVTIGIIWRINNQKKNIPVWQNYVRNSPLQAPIIEYNVKTDCCVICQSTLEECIEKPSTSCAEWTDNAFFQLLCCKNGKHFICRECIDQIFFKNFPEKCAECPVCRQLVPDLAIIYSKPINTETLDKYAQEHPEIWENCIKRIVTHDRTLRIITQPI